MPEAEPPGFPDAVRCFTFASGPFLAAVSGRDTQPFCPPMAYLLEGTVNVSSSCLGRMKHSCRTIMAGCVLVVQAVCSGPTCAHQSCSASQQGPMCQTAQVWKSQGRTTLAGARYIGWGYRLGHSLSWHLGRWDITAALGEPVASAISALQWGNISTACLYVPFLPLGPH